MLDSEEDEDHGNAVLRAIRINSSSDVKYGQQAQDLRPSHAYLLAQSSVLSDRLSRSKSRSPHDDLRSRSRSSSSELEVDSPPHSPRSHSLVIPPAPPSIASSPISLDLPRTHLHNVVVGGGGGNTSLEMAAMGKRSELFSVTNLLREDLPKVVHKSNPFSVNIFRPHLDVLR